MRKFTAKCMALALAMSCILVTACSGNADSNTTTSAATTTAVEAGQTEVGSIQTETDMTDNAEDTSPAEDVTEDQTITVTLRIEGVSENLYYGEVTTGASNVLELMEEVDEENDDLTFTIADGYLSAINDEAAATFGGWDGWLYTVNGSDAPAMADQELYDGDSILFYYGDPYGVGMQLYPAFSLEDGIVTVTSYDTVYDADGNVSSVNNPVTDATVTWTTDGTATVYTTDENGQFTLSETDAAAGDHPMAIEKVNESGLPLVLRLEPDFVFTIE